MDGGKLLRGEEARLGLGAQPLWRLALWGLTCLTCAWLCVYCGSALVMSHGCNNAQSFQGQNNEGCFFLLLLLLLLFCSLARERLTFHFSLWTYLYVLSPDGVLQRGPCALGI